MNAVKDVPLLDLKAQYRTLKPELDAAIARVVESQYFIMGPDVAELEKEVANYCQAKHAIGCASGTDAILLALMAIGVKAGDEVICPSYTFFATAGSVHRLGATAVFVDIDPVTYNMDPALAREAAKQCKRLKAIMPVHLYGQCVDMNAYLELGRELHVPIIEDAAQAIGALDSTGAPAGSRGLIGCFSFFPSKNLGGFGDGGIITTNDDALAAKLSILRLHGSQPKYHHQIVGLNSRLDALQAAVLRVKLPHLDSWHEARRTNADLYDRLFKQAGATTTAKAGFGDFPLATSARPAPGIPARHIFNQYVIRVPAELRDDLREQLKNKNIGTEIYYPVPLHLQECFAALGYSAGDLPESEAAANETLALPIYPELTKEQITYVAETVVAFVNERAAVAS